MESLKAQEWDTYLLEWNKTWKEKQKLNNGSLGAAVLVIPVSLGVFEVRGKSFGWGKRSLSTPLYFHTGVARPGELSSPRRANLYFFFRGNIKHASPPYGLASAYSNLLTLESGVNYLFKTNNSSKYCKFKGYWASLQWRSLLAQRRERDNDRSVVTLSSICIRP